MLRIIFCIISALFVFTGCKQSLTDIPKPNPPVETVHGTGVFEYNNHYYHKKGAAFSGPKEVVFVSTSGYRQNYPVEWNYEHVENAAEDTNLKISGEVILEGGVREKIFLNVYVIGDIGGVINHSMAVFQTEPVILPDKLYGIDPSGKPLKVSIPVVWNKEGLSTESPGFQEVKGTAEFFGKTYSVSSSVRVVAPTYTVNNTSITEKTARIRESVNEDDKREQYEDLFDKNTTQAHSTSINELIFEYDTAQNFAGAKFIFTQNTGLDGITPTLTDSSTGKQIECELKKDSNSITLSFKNGTESVERLKVSFGGAVNNLAEIELYLGTRDSLKLNSSVDIESLKIGNETYDEGKLTNLNGSSTGTVPGSAFNGDIQVTGKDNAGVTVVRGTDKIILYVVSENGETNKTYTITKS
ncbi:MAG: hypothetical protein MSA98_00240 [Spirochaetia bacterium]|nr:hypothetical protein [Spirochaetia bacterium]